MTRKTEIISKSRNMWILLRWSFKYPKKHVKDIFFTWWRMKLFSKCPISFWVPHFSYLILKMGKMGHFKKNEHKKAGHLKKMHVINFKKENEPKMKRGISKKRQKLSHDKNIFHMLFRAFQNTPRNTCKLWFIYMTDPVLCVTPILSYRITVFRFYTGGFFFVGKRRTTF